MFFYFSIMDLVLSVNALCSGQEVGSLRLDGLLVAKKASPLTKKPRKVLLDLSIVDNGSEEPIINPKGGDISRRIWSNSCLLNEVVVQFSWNNSKVLG